MEKMNNLFESYENAWFALLMYKVAQKDGRSFLELNEKMKTDPAFSISPELNRRCLNTINKTFAKKRREKVVKSACAFLTKAAVGIALVSTLLVTVCAAFPGVRSTTLYLLIESTDVSTRLSMTDNIFAPSNLSGEDRERTDIDDFSFPEMLPGYEIAYRHDGEGFSRLRYKNANGSYLQIQITRDLDKHINMGTKNVNVESIFVEDKQILFIEQNDRCFAEWRDDDVYFIIGTLDLSRQEVLLWIQGFLEANQ